MPKVAGHTLEEQDRLSETFVVLMRQALQMTCNHIAATAGGVITAAGDHNINMVNDVWDLQVTSVLGPYVSQTYEQGALTIAQVLADELPLQPGHGIPVIPPLSVEEWMRGANNRLKNVGDDLWSSIRDEVATGIAQGESIDQISVRIQSAAQMTRGRASLIARTEIVAASNAGSFNQAKFLGLRGKKEWLATMDGRTRHDHAFADGQKQDFDVPFSVGGWSLMYPGDPGGPASEVCNCRCTVLFDFDDEVPQTTCGCAAEFVAATAPAGSPCICPSGGGLPTDLSAYFTSKQLLKMFMTGQKISPAFGGAKIHKSLEAMRAVGPDTLEKFTNEQLLKAIDREYAATGGKSSFLDKYEEWAKSTAGKKILGEPPPFKSTLKSTPAVDPSTITVQQFPPTSSGPVLLQKPSQSYFKILRDPGDSGDGYAPNGQWGKYGSSGVLVHTYDENGVARFLLIQRGDQYIGSQKYKWQLPGGGADSKEGPYEAAARELQEETAATTQFVEGMVPLGEHVYDGGAGWKYTTIGAHSPHGTFEPKVHGSTGDAQWFTLDELEKMVANGDIIKELSPTLIDIARDVRQLSFDLKKPPGLPPVAMKPAVSDIKFTGKTLGSHGAQVWENPKTGERWLFKPQIDMLTQIDLATSRLQSRLRLTRPGIYKTKIGNEEGSLQFMFKSKEAFPGGTFDPLSLSDEDLAVFQREQIFDWLISNHDTHSGQWIRLENGTLYGTDKGQAFKFLGKDKLDWTYVPVYPLGSDKLTYSEIWRAFAEGKNIDLHDPTKGALGEFIDRIEALSDTEYMDLFRPYVDELAKTFHKSPAEKAAFEALILERKHNIRKDFEDFYAKALDARAKALGLPQPPKIAAPAPTPISPSLGPSKIEAAELHLQGYPFQVDLNNKWRMFVDGYTKTHPQVGTTLDGAGVADLRDALITFMDDNGIEGSPKNMMLWIKKQNIGPWSSYGFPQPKIDAVNAWDLKMRGVPIKVPMKPVVTTPSPTSVVPFDSKADKGQLAWMDFVQKLSQNGQFDTAFATPKQVWTKVQMWAKKKGFDKQHPLVIAEQLDHYYKFNPLSPYQAAQYDRWTAKITEYLKANPTAKLHPDVPEVTFGAPTPSIAPPVAAPTAPPLPTTTSLVQTDKVHIYSLVKVSSKTGSISPSYSGKAIYEALQAAKKSGGWYPQKYGGYSDLELLRFMDEAYTSPSGKTFEEQVVKWLQTPAGKKQAIDLAVKPIAKQAVTMVAPSVPTPSVTPYVIKTYDFGSDDITKIKDTAIESAGKKFYQTYGKSYGYYGSTGKLFPQNVWKTIQLLKTKSVTHAKWTDAQWLRVIEKYTATHQYVPIGKYGNIKTSASIWDDVTQWIKSVGDPASDVSSIGWDTQQKVKKFFQASGVDVLSSPESIWQTVLDFTVNNPKIPYDELTIVRLVDHTNAPGLVKNQKLVEKKIIDWLKTPDGARRAQEMKLAAQKLSPVAKLLADRPDEFRVFTEDEALKLWTETEARSTSWTATQRAALKRYTGNAHGPLNIALRKQQYGTSMMTAADKKFADDLSAGMRPAVRRMVVHRGAEWHTMGKAVSSKFGDAAFAEAKKLIGSYVVDDGFMSTSVGGYPAFSGTVVYEFEIPAGAPMAFVDHISQHSGEREVILERALQYQVIDVEKDVYRHGRHWSYLVKLRVVWPPIHVK